MKRFILFILLSISSFVFPQSKDYNSETLAYFENKNWGELIELGEEAILNKRSSYPIEYRLAVAYYNTNNYFDSSKHFENIIYTYNINNEYIQEYLYYCFLFSGREADALLISKDFPFHLKKKINSKKTQIIDFISSELGNKFSNSRNIGVGNLSYFNFSLGHQFGYNLKLSHSYNSISQNYIDFDYKQREYYLNASIQVSSGLTLISGYHYINILENTVSSSGGRQLRMIYSTANVGKIHLFHMAIKKQWNRLSVMPNITYSSSNILDTDAINISKNNTQFGVDLVYVLKPFKDKIWIGLGGNSLNGQNTNDFIWNAEIYYQISLKTYFTVRYLNANSSNFSEVNARYYTNSVATLIDKFYLTFGYYFSENFSWFINYQNENDEDYINNISFTYNTLITGLKYNF